MEAETTGRQTSDLAGHDPGSVIDVRSAERFDPVERIPPDRAVAHGRRPARGSPSMQKISRIDI
jgi:hypothetical protein